MKKMSISFMFLCVAVGTGCDVQGPQYGENRGVIGANPLVSYRIACPGIYQGIGEMHSSLMVERFTNLRSPDAQTFELETDEGECTWSFREVDPVFGIYATVAVDSLDDNSQYDEVYSVAIPFHRISDDSNPHSLVIGISYNLATPETIQLMRNALGTMVISDNMLNISNPGTNPIQPRPWHPVNP